METRIIKQLFSYQFDPLASSSLIALNMINVKVTNMVWHKVYWGGGMLDRENELVHCIQDAIMKTFVGE